MGVRLAAFPEGVLNEALCGLLRHVKIPPSQHWPTDKHLPCASWWHLLVVRPQDVHMEVGEWHTCEGGGDEQGAGGRGGGLSTGVRGWHGCKGTVRVRCKVKVR